jgi:hypothetical protein
MSTATQPQPAKASRDAIDRLCINTIRTLSMDAVQMLGRSENKVKTGASTTADCPSNG